MISLDPLFYQDLEVIFQNIQNQPKNIQYIKPQKKLSYQTLTLSMRPAHIDPDVL